METTTQEKTPENRSSLTTSLTGENDTMEMLKRKQAELKKRHTILDSESEKEKAKELEDKKKLNEKGFCEKHGEYGIFFKTGFLDRIIGPFDCPGCRKEKKGIEAKEKEKQKRYENIEWNFLYSGIPKRYKGKTINDVDCDYHSDPENRALAKQTLKIITKYIETFEDRFEKGTSGFLSGACGTGKTMVACIVIDSVIRGGRAGRYTTAWNLIQDIRKAYSTNESIQSIVKEFVSVDFLVIDEVGVQGGTNDERVLLYQVIDGRYNEMKPTLLISNSKDPVADGYLDARTIDRLQEDGGFSISFEGDSYRVKK